METIQCKFCGIQTPMTTTKLCDRCWEVSHRVESIIRSNGTSRSLQIMAAIFEEYGINLTIKEE